MIAGLDDIAPGELLIGGQRCNDLEPRDRGFAMVYQNHALSPHLTLAENMGFGLSLRKRPRGEMRERVPEAARLLKLDALLGRVGRLDFFRIKAGACLGGQVVTTISGS